MRQANLIFLVFPFADWELQLSAGLSVDVVAFQVFVDMIAIGEYGAISIDAANESFEVSTLSKAMMRKARQETAASKTLNF